MFVELIRHSRRPVIIDPAFDADLSGSLTAVGLRPRSARGLPVFPWDHRLNRWLQQWESHPYGPKVSIAVELCLRLHCDLVSDRENDRGTDWSRHNEWRIRVLRDALDCNCRRVEQFVDRSLFCRNPFRQRQPRSSARWDHHKPYPKLDDRYWWCSDPWKPCLTSRLPRQTDYD